MAKKIIPPKRPAFPTQIKKPRIIRKPGILSTGNTQVSPTTTTETSTSSTTSNSIAMTPFIGQIIMFAGNFAPRGWALCDGQLLAISSNSALFSILGTTYGGDGRTNFALPDMRGRVTVHHGNGPGLSDRRLGENAGNESINIALNHIPSHTHNSTLVEKGNNPTNGTPTSAQAAPTDSSSSEIQSTTSATGGSQPLGSMQPYLVINYIIAMQGVYPSRS